jgi:hypothetical protein
MILNPEHRSDLKIDKAGTANHRDNLEFDKDTGEFKRFYKIRMWENNAAPLYSPTGELKARGSIKEDGDQYASTFFYSPIRFGIWRSSKSFTNRNIRIPPMLIRSLNSDYRDTGFVTKSRSTVWSHHF